jgi:hypothetical protein
LPYSLRSDPRNTARLTRSNPGSVTGGSLRWSVVSRTKTVSVASRRNELGEMLNRPYAIPTDRWPPTRSAYVFSNVALVVS